MASNLMLSNSLPFGKEEVILRDLLSQQSEELATLNRRVESKRCETRSFKASLNKLEMSLKAATDALAIYEQHKNQLAATHQALSTRFSATLASENNDLTFVPFLGDDLAQRIESCRTEDRAVEEACNKLHLSITSLNEDLRCQKHQLAVSEMSLRVSISTRDEMQGIVGSIKDKFSSIKRVPDEIWLAILEIMVEELNEVVASDSSDTTTSSVALPLSQVCRAWRRVILRSPDMWATIHCHAAVGKDLVGRRKLMSLFVERAQSRRLTTVDKRKYRVQTHGWCWWWPEPYDSGVDPSVNAKIGGCTYHTLLSSGYPSSGQGSPRSTQPQALVFEAKGAMYGSRPLSDRLLQNIKPGSLTFINLAIQAPQSTMLDGLTDLKIVFNSQNPVELTRPYSLSPFLGAGLRSLHLAHYESGMVTWTGFAISLPQLTTLLITPNEHHLLDKLELPALKSLTIADSPGPNSISVDTWVPKVAPLCRGISLLILDRLTPMLPVFLVLYPHATKLEALTISHCTLEGPELCLRLEKLAEDTLNKLPSLTIESCVGLSQADCERLSRVVDKLNVFRTFHHGMNTWAELSTWMLSYGNIGASRLD